MLKNMTKVDFFYLLSFVFAIIFFYIAAVNNI